MIFHLKYLGFVMNFCALIYHLDKLGICDWSKGYLSYKAVHVATTDWSSQFKSKTQWNSKQPLLPTTICHSEWGKRTSNIGAWEITNQNNQPNNFCAINRKRVKLKWDVFPPKIRKIQKQKSVFYRKQNAFAWEERESPEFQHFSRK